MSLQMKKLVTIILVVGLISCKQEKDKKEAHGNIIDNLELIELYEQDQSGRQGDNIEWGVLLKQDSLRRVRVRQLLDSNKVLTSLDYHNAAMIFQHGYDTVASGMAVKLMRKSLELDPTADKWLLAAAIDRDLMRKDQPQIYGTQFIRKGKDEPWELYKIDTTKISDAERVEYGVRTLAEQKAKVKK